MMNPNPKRPAPSGNKTMHSKPTVFGTGSIGMPAAMPAARFSPKNDHDCKVCPGSKRAR